MKQGASRHALKARKDDLYETPECCVSAALAAGVLSSAGSHIWESCAGRGAISRHLRAAGYTVTAHDLVAYDGADSGITTSVDFLMEQRAPEGVTAIVTNPPFKLANEFIRHGLRLVPRVIVLQRAMAIEGAGRADLIDGHLRAYWIGIDRPPAMHREGWTGNRLSNSGAPFAWFDFHAEPRPKGEPIALHRLRWKTENGVKNYV
jgi:hypothetical protein